jgi:hypothetical protein
VTVVRRRTLPAPLEKDVQRGVYRLLVQLGCGVYWMSQARATQQTAGVPDLLVFSPARGLFFVECKRPGGQQSPAQRSFQLRSEAAGVRYILGGVVEVAEYMGASTTKDRHAG